MPEYLAPGVYIEETSFRPKTIEGVSTSTAGFVGPTRFGPVSGEPELLTSYTEFERIYGGLDQLEFDNGAPVHNYMAHAARAFFNEGGKRLYVSRIYHAEENSVSNNDKSGHAKAKDEKNPLKASLSISARHPGKAGEGIVSFLPKLGENIFDKETKELKGAREYDVVVVKDKIGTPPDWLSGEDYLICWLEKVENDEGQKTFRFHPAIESPPTASDLLSDIGQNLDSVQVLTVDVTFERKGKFSDPHTWQGLGFHQKHLQGLTKVFSATPLNRATELWVPLVIKENGPHNAATIAKDMLNQEIEVDKISILEALTVKEKDVPSEKKTISVVLEDGNDGQKPGASNYMGDVDDNGVKSGLVAFEDLENISIIAAPGSTGLYDGGDEKISQAIVNNLLIHCNKMRYRVAVLDTPPKYVTSEAGRWRAKFDNTRAAMYYPWVKVLDPLTNDEINLPPSGFVAGIYARNDIDHGVHKAPANEVVRSAIGFELLINKGQQDVLNPKGINCFRFFAGRGFRLWGARTISSDPEWKYISVRRYFAYIERSIDRGTQWVVFENNSEPLWAKVKRTVEDFLLNEWKSGHLMGTAPEQAYFVQCDRSTMTQNDIDNGRLVCLIGVAPVKPAEFVIFRIGQWTANSNS